LNVPESQQGSFELSAESHASPIATLEVTPYIAPLNPAVAPKPYTGNLHSQMSCTVIPKGDFMSVTSGETSMMSSSNSFVPGWPSALEQTPSFQLALSSPT
jgi:hypothetical protein